MQICNYAKIVCSTEKLSLLFDQDKLCLPALNCGEFILLIGFRLLSGDVESLKLKF